MKVNIDDVAKRSGVSVVTVSRVINGVKTVRENNRRKVLKAMEELDYQPNHAARVLASGRTGVVGLIMSDLNDAFLEGVVRSVQANLMEHQFFLALSVIPIGESDSYLFQKERVDGVVLLCPTNEDETIIHLKQKQIPFVLLDNQKEHDVPSVVVDNFKGGYMATRHLQELNHHKIGHIAGPDVYLSSKERKKGFLKALDEMEQEPYAIGTCPFSVEGGFSVVKKWIENDTVPTAIFAADDFIALGAINALVDSGYRVPDDVSIIGYDDQKFAPQYHPKLTTIKQPEEEMGEKGAELLVKMIKGNITRSYMYKLEPKIVVRESTKALK